MIKIQKYNKISDIIENYLPGSDYQLGEDMTDYQAIIVRSAKLHEVEFPKELLAIARAGAGTNNVPVEKCTGEGICVFNSPGANANAVKELALAGLLMASRNVLEGCNWVQTLKGQEDVPALVEKGKKEFVGPEVSGKKIGIIGLGAIGTLLANACYQLGMEVMGYDPYVSVDAAWKLNGGIKRAATTDEIFAECDFVSLHSPLNDSTRGMIGSQQLAAMRDGVILLNFARGGLVDTKALLNALQMGKVRKYVIDFPDGDMLGVKDIIAIPHLGASSPESEENCAIMAAQELNSYLKYGNIENSVNLPNCSLPYDGHPRLTFIHKNTPNMVGQISSALGDSGLNIENMINKGGKEVAYTIIDVDKAVDEAVQSKLQSIDGMIRVRAI